MDELLIPLIGFMLITSIFVFVSVEQFFERGFSFYNLAGCLLKVGASGLFFLPVSAILFDDAGQWYVVEVITLLFALGVLCALIGELNSLFSARGRAGKVSGQPLHGQSRGGPPFQEERR